MSLLCSTDAAENDTEDQHDDGDAAVDVFAQTLDETADAIFAAHLDLAGSEAFAADPEEHDPGEQRAIAEIGEDVRRDRHIGALMGGIAICAIVLLALSAVSLVKGLIAGVSFMQITTSLNLGHVLCFICVLAGVRFFVMGDKNADYNAPQKARKRTQLVGVLFILGFICLLAAIFVELPVVLTVQAVVVFALALVLILAWKLSGKI